MNLTLLVVHFLSNSFIMENKKLSIKKFFGFMQNIAEKYEVKYHFPTCEFISLIRKTSSGIIERTIVIPMDTDDFDAFKDFLVKEFELPWMPS